MQFYNEITTPSGKSCKIYDLYNKDYIILQKFIVSNNMYSFFESLDQLLSDNIKDFKSYTIYDKCYIYLALCIFCIKGKIQISHKQFGSLDIELIDVLDIIENEYKSIEFTIKINDNISLLISFPNKIIVQDGDISIDYLSGIIGVIKDNKITNITEEQREQLINKLNLSVSEKIIKSSKKKLKLYSNVFAKNKIAQELSLNLSGDDLLHFIYNIYKDDLNGQYNLIYNALQHLHLSYSDYLLLTPTETLIIFQEFIKQKEEEAESYKNSQKNNS